VYAIGRPANGVGASFMRLFASVGVLFFAIAASGSGSAAETRANPPCDPYVTYSCLDLYLGDDPLTRLVNYYRLEWSHDTAPADPKALPSARKGWPTTPQTAPPFPFTEWPYGGTQNLGVTRANSVDSPFMAAIANTALGQVMAAGNMQIYGWVNVGGNISSNGTRPGGNFPISYMYTPNTAQLDQAVIYYERVPDTVQSDHVDWGFRLSAIYGENYRYTTAYGLASYQLLNHNLVNGYDFPMEYGEVFFPQLGDGFLVRFGRYISVPDIEAQLAPNNYMYSHSMTYTFDNYTNTGGQTTLAVTPNWFVQLGVSVGTESLPWHWGQTIPNPSPNIAYPSPTMPIDPGAQPTFTAGVRWQSDNGYDNLYLVANAMNSGIWGYNNLQWQGITWFHKFDENWHFGWESYHLSQSRVLNITDPAGIIARGAFPFAIFPFNAPNLAICKDPHAPWCTANAYASVMYLNYKFSGLDSLSFRPEFYDDEEGQRTGTRTRYVDFGIGWQHWFSPQIELRPEVDYYHSVDANAYNGNANGSCPFAAINCPGSIVAPNKNYTWLGAMDVILHF
jgi:hypothetical protein